MHISQSESKLLKANREEIKRKIIAAVDGMYVTTQQIASSSSQLNYARFLLAQLHFDSIVSKKTAKNLKQALESLSKGSGAYRRAYEEAMERINGQDTDSKELARQVLLWITCARRPLTISELQHALAVEVGESELDRENLCQIEDMVSVCAGLVTVDEESRIIRLVHYTTQEYFEATQKKWFPNAESHIATACVTYLSFLEFESGICECYWLLRNRLESNQLYHYASLNWGHHAREASTLIPQVNSFLEKNAQVKASSQVLLRKTYFEPVQNGLHLAAFLGL
jgi:hypothetical protein